MSEIYELYVVTRPMLPDTLRAAREGVVAARMALALIEQAIGLMQRGPISCMCLDCEAEFTSAYLPPAFALIVPMFPKKRACGVSCAICLDCLDRTDLEEKINEALREMEWADGTKITIQRMVEHRSKLQ
jgi:hypothetical protein